MWGKPDIDDKICFLHMDDFRPTLKRKFIRGIYDSRKYHDLKICDYLSKTEEEARAFVGLTKEEFDKIVGFFKRYNLHFGMTEEEFDAYRDAEYFEKHPEESPDYVNFEPTAEEIEQVKEIDEEAMAAAVEKQREEFVAEKLQSANLDGSLDTKPIPTWDALWFEKEFNKLISITTNRDVNANDLEWQRARMLEVAFTSLPWYYRLFPIEIQMQKARHIYEALFKEYCNGLRDRLKAFDQSFHNADVERIKKENDEIEYKRQRIREQAAKEFDNLVRENKIKITVPKKELDWEDGLYADELKALLTQPYKFTPPKVLTTLVTDEI